jgi:hypothetical protein
MFLNTPLVKSKDKGDWKLGLKFFLYQIKKQKNNNIDNCNWFFYINKKSHKKTQSQ